MKFSILSAAIATGLLVVCGTSEAQMRTNNPSRFGAPAVTAPLGTDVTLYSQLDNPAGNGVPDQDFEASFDLYDSSAADDFVVTSASGWTINRINTVGTTGTPGGATVNVTIRSNSAGGGDPDLPGAPVCTYTGLTPTDTLGSFSIALTSPCIVGAGTHWVEIQTAQTFSGFGQHFWSNRSTQSGSESVFRNAGDGFASGCTTFTPVTTCGVGGGTIPDLLFEVVGVVGGLLQPVTSAPPSGPVAFPNQSAGGVPTTANIVFTNPNAVAATITCTAPAAPQFTANPLIINVPANGSASTTVSFSSALAGAFVGTLTCSGSGGETFTYNLSGTSIFAGPVPSLSDSMRWLLLAGLLGLGLVALRQTQR